MTTDAANVGHIAVAQLAAIDGDNVSVLRVHIACLEVTFPYSSQGFRSAYLPSL